MHDPFVPSDLVTHVVNDQDWLIEDRRFPADDARHLIAFVHEERDELCEVIWVQGFRLPKRYKTASEILNDAVVWMRRGHRSTRPIPIPHFPPVPLTAQSHT